MKKLLVTALFLVFAVTAFATDFSFYGSLRFSTFYTSTNSDYNDYNYGVDESDLDIYNWGNTAISRLGVKADIGNGLKARIEMGLKGSNKGNTVYTRLYYVDYNMGALTLRLGQDYTPVGTGVDQVFDSDNDMAGFGALYEGRIPQIKLMAGGFQLALISPKKTGNGTQFDSVLPKIEAAYKFKVDPVSLGLEAGYTTYKYDDDFGASDETFTAYVLAAEADFNVNVVDVYLSGFYGTNLADYGFSNLANSTYLVASDDDTTTWGAIVGLTFKVADNIKATVGYGYTKMDNDAWAENDEQQAYFANLKYAINKNFFIQPEVGVYDYMKDNNDVDEGKMVYFGAKWQVNF
ncbi:hypothetical protein DEFDS_1796 [Deferribacter desulfuricans SSM1]|uniref:Uncharacterized protein n=1 Tax=Deferribacter desulfuricans (strain DSM 14783 / JCM 11476 / NBRC 101012 / SSM1) TaxID=639282 RepID=D3P961_DEFDS|nr:outer membrane beta-barrel protein [Deferribacter desulfuricans]BAI81251.1 hypothetical protein DEFDS_1796 [Deferribacter desulfuricans SSM1]